MPERVPLLDLRRAFETCGDDVRAAIEKVLANQQFILGEDVAAFEKELAAWLGTREVVSCASGTDALLLALAALDVGPGDEVITTPFTFIATVGAIVRLGARPVFVDIDPDTFCIDPAAAVRAMNPRTRALIPVHLYGQSADLAPILDAAGPRGIAVIEDAAQALGATYGDRKAGTLGRINCHSFFPSKNLGGLGDGGAINTEDPDLAARLRRLRVHGARARYDHVEVGLNSRLDTLQAACLRVKLRHLDGALAQRRAAAKRYDELLAPVARGNDRLVLPREAGYGRHSWNLYTVRVKDRDTVAARLKEKGADSAVHYPIPLHLQECFRGLGHRAGDFPAAEQAAREVLSLPLFPGITDDEQVRTAAALGEVPA